MLTGGIRFGIIDIKNCGKQVMDMRLEERVFCAKNDNAQRDTLIEEYTGFVLSCAKKTVGRYISPSDDEASIALIAFNEAITKYEEERGHFLDFASMMIKSRLIDHLRKLYRDKNTVPFSSLSTTDDDGNETDFDIGVVKEPISDTAFELEAIKREIAKFGISYMDLPKDTPKTKKTKEACYSVIRYILKNEQALTDIKEKGVVPVSEIIRNLGVNKKLLERHRKYIIVAVVVLSGDYSIIAEYFRAVREA
ncbi:MAG: RNA polymerase sigma factor SigI [Firmicutes bacterium ADurb.Bin193]|nr:MAG: RNA polymerase sigma factor SigI [Firmicutes bacterium ADurb.Bin193]